MVDLPVYVEKALALEILSAFMEELQSESMNLCMKKQLDIILLAANDTRHRINRLRRQLKHLLQRISAIVPLMTRFVLLNTPPRLAIQCLDCYIINVPLIIVI